MPFGLDLKSIIVGVLFALFVYPWLKALLMSRSNSTPSKAA